VRVLGLSAALAVALAPQAGRAQTIAADRVPVVLAGGDGEAAALEPVVADLLGRLHVDFTFTRQPTLDVNAVVTPPADPPRALARVFCDLTHADRLTLYLVDSSWERVLVRIVRRDPAHAEIAREELGHIVETAVEALRSGARIGVARETLAPTPPPPPPSPPPPPPSHVPPAASAASSSLRPFPVELRPAVFYEAEDLTADTHLGHEVGASLWIVGGDRRSWRPGAHVTAGYRFPLDVEAPPIGVNLQAVPIRALAGAVIPLGRRIELQAGLGAGADIVWVTPVALSSAAVLTPRSTDVVPLGRAALALSYGGYVDVGFGLDVAFERQRYSFVVNGVSETALEAMPVRPSIFVEAGIPLFGR
jgi:hypothetical protein